MMCFHLLRPYKAPEKHPPCCSMCKRVCGFVCLRERERLRVCFPACTNMALLWKKPVSYEQDKTPDTDSKTQMGEVNMWECSPLHHDWKTLHFPREGNGLWTLFFIQFYEWVQGWKHVLYINSMKTGRALSVTYWSDEWLGLEIKCLWIQSWLSCQHSRRPVSKAHIQTIHPR